MITDERADKALEYLVGTDKGVAELKGQMLFKEQLCKVARAKVFKASEGAIDARKAEAELSEEVQDADREFMEATVEFETVRNRRSTATTIIDMFRTEEASRRQGNV